MALTDVIDNYPGYDEGVDGFTLGMRMQAGAERFGAKTEYTEVLQTELKGKIKRILTPDGERLAKTIVIATGANPRPLGLAGEESFVGRGLHYCAHCDGRFYKDKVVAVVGGGNSAVSDALYLSGLAKKVYLIHRRASLRATAVYEKPLMTAENVEFLWNNTVAEWSVSDGKLTGVVLQNTQSGERQSLSLDGLFVSVGRLPATELFAGQVDLDAQGYVIADETTKTNLEGVFAVGDVRTKLLRQVVTAVGDGAVAAHLSEEYLKTAQEFIAAKCKKMLDNTPRWCYNTSIKCV